MKLSYYDLKAETRLETYADTIVTEQDGKAPYIAAIRFGGYPESVRGMSEAIFGGGSVTVELNSVLNEDVGGGPSDETKRESIGLFSRVKQYRKEFSHDGIYAEATLMVVDEEQRASDDDADIDSDGANEKVSSAARKCYLFCEAGDSDRLFEELDKKTAVPLIPEFKEYVLSQLQSRGILKPLQVISCTESFDVWLLTISAGEANIIDVINEGLRTGAISIPGDGTDADMTAGSHEPFPEVNSVTGYLNAFGIQIAERIKGQFNPLFDPATESLSSEILAVNSYIRQNAGYSLFDAQLAVAEAHKRCLQSQKGTLCIAECGSGKTKIGITALHAYQQGKLPGEKHFNIVLCPSHMTRKWVREIEESLPNTFAVVVTSIREIKEVYEAYEWDDKTCYIIMSKEKARDGYMRRPAARWSRTRKAFICPNCYESIEMELINCGSKYKVPADQLFFKKENKNNRKCDACGDLLWTILVPSQQSEWVKISDFGFVHRGLAHQYLSEKNARMIQKKPGLFDAIKAVADNPDGHFPSTGAYNRFPLSTYIRRKMKGKIDGLVVDELHNYSNNSGQGDAMGELFQTAKKVVGMTATLINGYSSGIFHLLYRISPELMLKDGKKYEKPLVFNAEYGVTESVYEKAEAEYNSNRRTAKRKIRERQLPGVSPLVYSRFLMDSAAFLSLNDMGKNLPEYEEFPVQLAMNDDVDSEYRRIENQFRKILREQKDIAQKVLSSYLSLLTVFPDQPYGHEPVKHPISGDDLVVPADTSSIEELHEKDYRVLDIVQRKVRGDDKTGEIGGGRVLIYTSWTRIDTQQKLSKLLTEQGHRVAVLTTSVSPNKREDWVQKQVRSGIDVLIVNPSLVETGLDLIDFTTLIYYNISYNLFTLRQSSRRSWRINQRAPRVEVYFMYYEGTMQHRAIRLMASKMAVAGIIEGNFTDEGLAAMSDCADMTTALARELTQGIKNEVEDLGAVFKKMAILKPASEDHDVVASIDEKDAVVVDVPMLTPIVDVAQSASVRERTSRSISSNSVPSGLLSLIRQPKVKKAQTKKVVAAHDGQLSLADLMGDSA